MTTYPSSHVSPSSTHCCWPVMGVVIGMQQTVFFTCVYSYVPWPRSHGGHTSFVIPVIYTSITPRSCKEDENNLEGRWSIHYSSTLQVRLKYQTGCKWFSFGILLLVGWIWQDISWLWGMSSRKTGVSQTGKRLPFRMRHTCAVAKTSCKDVINNTYVWTTQSYLLVGTIKTRTLV